MAAGGAFCSLDPMTTLTYRIIFFLVLLCCKCLLTAESRPQQAQLAAPIEPQLFSGLQAQSGLNPGSQANQPVFTSGAGSLGATAQVFIDKALL